MSVPVERLAQIMVNDPLLDQETAEFVKEAGRTLLESLSHDDLEVINWKVIITASGRASLSMGCAVPLPRLQDVTFESLVPATGKMDLKALQQHHLAPVLKRELPDLQIIFLQIMDKPEYEEVKTDVKNCLDDMSKVMNVLLD